jgi:hypothetical protein
LAAHPAAAAAAVRLQQATLISLNVSPQSKCPSTVPTVGSPPAAQQQQQQAAAAAAAAVMLLLTTCLSRVWFKLGWSFAK